MAGAAELQLPEDIRDRFYEHLATLKERYAARGWGGRVGMGERPAIVVIDLAERWVNPSYTIGSDLESVVESTARLLDAARKANVPIFFTTMAYGPDDPPLPTAAKHAGRADESEIGGPGPELDPRLGRLPTEKLIVKKYASSFKGTNLQDMLSSLKVDTLIVTGCSTSHCVYATARDACSAYQVIVPEEAVGDRCEVMHLVNLLDIDISIGDVMPVDEVIAQLGSPAKAGATA